MVNEKAIISGLLVLQKVSRRIATFVIEHRLFKQFTYQTIDHQVKLMDYAKKLLGFLEKNESHLAEKYG